ncbi:MULTISPECIES: phosphatidylinositol phosphate synthase [unclassified Actinotalea]|uniref:phosphatidylinositol phosphate synthase n=1 Tax=unclassified Actinotalea TaxID=2638618 RepID=UPI0015F67A33|nr:MULTISPECIES: CDP-alcohol phosphatidyltransferase family protein [unclassified Actinotalea]
MLNRLRAGAARVVGPFARFLLARGVSPDAVTVTGTVGVVLAALWLLPTGHLLVGALVIAFFALTDMIDGVMARTAGRASSWGAFLDSTLDRFGDAAIFSGLLLFLATRDHDLAAVLALACLVLGSVVPYARARAEGLGMRADVGIAERADRLAVVLVATAVVGLGAPVAVLTVVLALLAVASAVTVAQRMAVVYRQAHAAGRGAPGAGEA